jgi:phosphohistidine swiveling domain-containing protein
MPGPRREEFLLIAPDDGRSRVSPLDGAWFDLGVPRVCGDHCGSHRFSLKQTTETCSRHPIRGRKKRDRFRVPSAPFIHWCLAKTHALHLAPAWVPLSKSGVKVSRDNPFHTDWMLGAGMNPRRDYLDEAVAHAANRMKFRVQQKMCEFEALVLSGSGATPYLTVVHPEPDEELRLDQLAVIPYASADYYIPASSARAVVTARGGALSHLSVVGQEQGILLLLVEDALSLYPPGCRVRVDANRGHVDIDSSYNPSLRMRSG